MLRSRQVPRVAFLFSAAFQQLRAPRFHFSTHGETTTRARRPPGPGPGCRPVHAQLSLLRLDHQTHSTSPSALLSWKLGRERMTCCSYQTSSVMGEHEKEATNEGCFACFTGPWKSLRAKSRKNSQNEPCTNPSGDESAIVTATVNSPSPPTNEGRPSSIGLSPAQNTQVVPPENPGYNELASPSSPPPENRKQAPPVLGLWAQAAQRLDSTERDKVEALMGSTKGIANDHVESVLSSAQNLKDGEGDYRWQPVRSFWLPKKHFTPADTLHRSSIRSSKQPWRSRVSVTA